MQPANPSYGFKVFVTIWIGQLVSSLGSSLTGFALGVWVYQQTGSATRYALISLFMFLPGILLSPFAGALADRWDRRRVMILGDSGSALCTLALVGLVSSGRLEIWHIYVLQSLSATLTSLQWPAFSATVPLLVPKRDLGRANGMIQVLFAVPQIVAPMVAGLLMGRIGIGGVALIDGITFLVSLLTLALVRFPRPKATAEGLASRGSLVREAAYGWYFIRGRPGLLIMLLLFATTNFCVGFLQVLLTPLVLSFTTTEVLGVVLSVAGCGLLAGSLVVSLWRGPTRRIPAILAALVVQGSLLFLGGVRPDARLIAAAAFVFLFASPVIESSSQVIWQSKVALDLQGRVFSVRRMVAWSTLPLAYVVAGPLADRVFEPLLLPGGPLADSLGRVVGVGPGRGIGLLFVVLGALLLLAVAAASRSARLRGIESELPDAIPETPEGQNEPAG